LKEENMFKVTERAVKKLKETLQEQTQDPEVAIRIIVSPSTPNQLELVLDKEREGDEVVQTEDGTVVLLISSSLALALKGMVMDWQHTAEGERFTISKLSKD
jgi:Fe-S cluster assembly iron-binding protein IscA